ncbi:MAG: peptidyl-prolyl cis-trans isomerase, partial [Pseudomonadota bacterium]
QLGFGDDAEADAFVERARAAGGLDAARGEDDPAPVDLGVVERNAVPAALADVAFAAGEGDVVGPAQSSFGWHVAEIVSATAENRPSFADAQEQLRQTLAEDEAFVAIDAAAEALDEALGAGLPMAEAAEAAGLDFASVADLDRSGGFPDADAPPFDAPGGEVFLATLFETPEAQPSLLIEDGDGGVFALEVTEIAPPAPLPFDAVRDDIAALLADEAAAGAARAAAEAVADRLRAGQTPQEILDAGDIDGKELLCVAPFGRNGILNDGSRAPISGVAVEAAFAAAPRDVIVVDAFDGAAALRMGWAEATVAFVLVALWRHGVAKLLRQHTEAILSVCMSA